MIVKEDLGRALINKTQQKTGRAACQAGSGEADGKKVIEINDLSG